MTEDAPREDPAAASSPPPAPESAPGPTPAQPPAPSPEAAAASAPAAARRPLGVPPRLPGAATRPQPRAWAVFAVAGAILGAIGLFHYEKSFGAAPAVYEWATIAKVSRDDPASWYRLIAGLFVHGSAHALQALVVFSAVVYSGLRVERGLGAGAFLLCFLVGGVAGDVMRAWHEAPGLLHDSAGTTAGALALVGAAASVGIRTRELNFVWAIVSAIGSALLTTFFSAAPQQNPSLSYVLPPLLPGAGVAFVVGGFLGGLLPLYEPSRRRAVRGAFLVVALAVLLGGIGLYFQQLWPHIGAARAAVSETDGLDYQWDPRFKKWEFALPPTHVIETSHKTDDVVLRCTEKPSLEVHLTSYPRQKKDEYSAAGFQAVLLGKAIVENSPKAEQLESSELDCPLGPAHRVIIRVYHEDGRAFDRAVCVVQTEDDYVVVQVVSVIEDLAEAQTLSGAIVRSLKVHSPPADKRDGGRSR